MECRKVALFLTTNCLLILATPAQTPDWSWAKRSGGSSNEFSTSVTTDPSGNIITCGYFNSPTLTIGTTTLTNNGFYDIFVSKYDPSGNVIWAIGAGGNGDDNAGAVATDNAGNIYLTGSFASTSINFGLGVLVNGSPGSSDIYLVKLNPAGSPVWTKSFPGNDWDVGQCVISDPLSGNIYLAGYLSSLSVDFGTGALSTNGLADAFLTKFDANGNNAWSISSGGTLNDLANGVDIDNAGDVYITGGFASSSMTFGTNTLVNAGPGFPDIFTAKYTAAGVHVWSKREGGPNNDHMVAVDVDRFGNVFVAGHFHSASMTVGTTTLLNGGNGDPILFKYTNSGNIIWAKSTGGFENDFGHTVITDSAGNVYLAGMFMSSSITFGSTTLPNSSMMMEDIFLAKYDSAGNVLWAKGGGGNYPDYINDLAIHPASNKLFATGDFASPAITLGSTLLTNADNTGNTYDCFVGKLDVLTGDASPFDNSSGLLGMTDPEITVYPNPCSEMFTVFSSQFTGKMEIFNFLGECVFSMTITTPHSEFRIPNLTKGQYLIKFSSEGRVYTNRLSRL